MPGNAQSRASPARSIRHAGFAVAAMVMAGDNTRFQRACWLEDRMPIERLADGQAFHRTVQSAFLTGLMGASGFKERRWRLIAGGRGRVDLAVEVDGSEQMLVIVEIKGTDWDKIATARIMRNLRRHLRQLQGYLDTAIEEMEAGCWVGIVGSLLYPARPASIETVATIEAVAGEQAIMVTWYEDVDWRQSGLCRRPRSIAATPASSSRVGTCTSTDQPPLPSLAGGPGSACGTASRHSSAR